MQKVAKIKQTMKPRFRIEFDTPFISDKIKSNRPMYPKILPINNEAKVAIDKKNSEINKRVQELEEIKEKVERYLLMYRKEEFILSEIARPMGCTCGDEEDDDEICDSVVVYTPKNKYLKIKYIECPLYISCSYVGEASLEDLEEDLNYVSLSKRDSANPIGCYM